jgi:hypothetical protein
MFNDWDAFTIEWRGIKFHFETSEGFAAFTEIIRNVGKQNAQQAR